MKNLLPCIIFFILWNQVVAPVPDPCTTLNDVRFSGSYPQLCTLISGPGILQWHYFCDNIAMKEARVLCKVLDYPGASSFRQSSMSGAAIDNLECNGDETLLTQCSYNNMTLTTSTCTYVEIVCHQCTGTTCGAGLCFENGTCACNEVCDNEGYCFLGNCICPQGFGGPVCRDCSPPCQNGGLCSADDGCQCMGSFYGTACELNSTESTNGSTALTTVQTTNNNNTVIPAEELSLTIVIAIVVPALICSCTIIIVCFGILVFLAFVVIRMKPVLSEKVELNTYQNSESSNPSSIKKPPTCDLEDSNHDYCYIKGTVIPNTSSTKQTTAGIYEVMTLEESSKDHIGIIKDTTANDVSMGRNNSHYEIENIDDY